ncbi:MAG: beta strand repeat-containing protein, partial [Chthoniobacterales bacterium]
MAGRRGSVLAVLLAAFCVALISNARAQWDLYVGGQAGAQIFWNTDLTRIYNFGVTTSGGTETVVLSNVLVSAKRSGGTTGNWTVELYNGFGGTGSLLTSAFATNSVFGTTDFSTFTLGLTNPVSLTAGAYSIKLVSQATGVGNNQMYLKESKLLLTDSTNITNTVSSVYWVEDVNTTGTAGTNIAPSDGYVLADYQVSTTNVNFGNYRIGATLATNVLLTNTAFATTNNVSESLTTSTSASNQATVSGLGTNFLARGATTNFTAGLSTANAGTNSGVITLNYSSVTNGSASTRGAATNIGSQTVAVTGVGYRLADDAVSTTDVDLGKFHIGYTTNNGSLSGTVGVTNTATGDGFSEGLAVANDGTSNGATVGGIPGGLIAAGASTNITVGLGAVSAVGTNSGTVTLGFQSSGDGTSGFAATNIGTQVINVTALGYSGQAYWNQDSGGSWNNFDNWDIPGGTPGIDGALLSTNDQATFGSMISASRTVNLDGQNPVLTLLAF